MARASLRPDWQRAITTLSGVLVFVVVVALLYFARTILIPVALAVFFTFVLAPIVNALQRRRLGRVPSVLLVVSGTVLVLGLTMWLIGQQVSGLTKTLPDYADNIKTKVATVREWIVGDKSSRFNKFIEEISEALAPGAERGEDAVVATPTVVERNRVSWTSKLEMVVSPAIEALGQAAFAFILVVFMLLKKEDLRNRVLRLIGYDRVMTTTKAVDDASQRVSRYLLTQFLLNSAFGFVMTIGLLLLGVRYAPLWGFLAGLMRYVPYLGTWVGLIPPVLFSLAISEGLWQPIAVACVYLGLEALMINALEPWLYGSSLGMSAVAQLIAAAFWAFLWGPVGLILSGPLTTCLLVLGKYVPQLQFLEILLGDEPPLDPGMTFFQRLTAHDQDEATEIIQEQKKTLKAGEIFDRVVVPALALTRKAVEKNNLSTEDSKFILAATREIVAEVAEEAGLQPKAGAEADASVRLLLCPARDEIDEVVLEMLIKIMTDQKWELQVTPAATLAAELLEQVGEYEPAILCIGCLPPGGLAHTRYLCKRLRASFPKLKIVVGHWGKGDQLEALRADLCEAGADEVDVCLESVRKHLHAWHQALLDQQKLELNGEHQAKSKRAPFGTALAPIK
jgi:predicted PurR-regulated permease PerM